MMRFGVVGLGKMGLSHLAMVRALPDVEVVAVVDSAGYMLDVLGKYTGLATYPDLGAALAGADLDAIVIATPTRLHAPMVRMALEAGVHVFCEKPLCLTSAESRELAELAAQRGLVTQVGYHNRFVGTFREVKRLLDAQAIGRVSHFTAEAYGPVVLRSKGSTWRSDRAEGGGLYDYAAHPVDLLSWYAGAPRAVGGTVLGSVFSQNTEDEVYGTLYYDEGASARVSVNWSDESYRKMTTQVTILGSQGRIHADRQELQVYLREGAPIPAGYRAGWNTVNTTELTDPVGFYLRGEEYSAQLEAFAARVAAREVAGLNDFDSAAVTDRVLELMTIDAARGPATRDDELAPVVPLAPRRGRGRRRA
jgi:predicted dehydrogenase